MTIRVGRHNEPNAVYIGRPSPLGNPFKMRNRSADERNRVCNLYAEWLTDQIHQDNESVLAELDRLANIALQGDLILGCHCAPLRCHGDTIKRILELMIALGKK